MHFQGIILISEMAELLYFAPNSVLNSHSNMSYRKWGVERLPLIF